MRKALHLGHDWIERFGGGLRGWIRRAKEGSGSDGYGGIEHTFI